MNIVQKIKEGANAVTEAMADCRKEATEKAVHRVRTRCRRLEAVVSAVLATHPGGAKELHAAGGAVIRKLKKIRRGAGAVRDLDIHMLLIEEMAGPSPDDFAMRLQKELTRERKRDAVVMLEIIDKHQKRLEKLAAEFLGMVEKLPPRGRQVDTTALAMAGFLEASAAMPVLRQDNLHDFRKRSKAARYIAEINLRSPTSARLAKTLNEIQDAIGVWHDWDVLVAEAEDALGKKGAPLVHEFASRRTTSYRKAIKVARQSQEQIVRRASASSNGR